MNIINSVTLFMNIITYLKGGVAVGAVTRRKSHNGEIDTVLECRGLRVESRSSFLLEIHRHTAALTTEQERRNLRLTTLQSRTPYGKHTI